jgi:exopolyphosphatase / guanosine-5'-triphosphate,3'-diphosphate pyrophosphatase
MSRPDVSQAGVIDIGSNSVRLVIFDVFGASNLPAFNEKEMAGLGEGLMESGKLSKEGISSALRAVARFRAILSALKVKHIVAVATAAVREAKDGPAFLKEVARELGTDVRLLAGQEEASLSALGVRTAFLAPQGVIGDLGGSSLEFELLSGKARHSESHLLGPLALAPYADDPVALRKQVRNQLATSEALSAAKGRFFAVGGAWRSFGKLSMDIEKYPLQVLQGYQMTDGHVARAVKLCVDSYKLPAARATLEAVDRRRARNMPIAAILLDEILERSKLDGVTISSSGLREGVLRDLLGAVAGDPLLDGIVAFARLDDNQIAFGKALFEFIRPVFQPEADLFGSPSADERVERAACLLADSAGRFHPDHRAQMAYDQVLRGPYSAITHAERGLLAHAIGCRYDRGFKRPIEFVSLNTDLQADRGRQLGSAMRLGAVFSGRSGPILQRAKLSRKGETLELRVRKADMAMISETVERRLEQTASLLRLKAKVALD